MNDIDVHAAGIRLRVTNDIIDNAIRIGQEWGSTPNIIKGTNKGIRMMPLRKIVRFAPKVKALTKVATKTIPVEPITKLIKMGKISENVS